MVVKVDFDIAMTLIANTLYKILAGKTKWFKKATPKTLSRNFIDNKTKGLLLIEWVKMMGRIHRTRYTTVFFACLSF